jgi:hypothetical protein
MSDRTVRMNVRTDTQHFSDHAACEFSASDE